MRIAAVLVLMFLLLPGALGATLSGTVYRADLSAAHNVLLTIDTQPQQRLLSANGTYSFEVPRGSYNLTVRYSQDGADLSLTERVVVAQDGDFSYDLFLLPGGDEQSALYEDLATDLRANGTDVGAGLPWDEAAPGTSAGPWPLIVLFLFIAAILIVPWLLLRRHFRKLDAQLLPGDSGAKLEQIVEIVRKEGGRISQRELRKRLPESEAKVSLMVAELVAKGRLEKVKSGRGNILVLKR